MYKHFLSLTVGANIYRSRTAINKQEGIGEGKENVWINDCIVWCETVKGEEWICKEKSVSELYCCNNNNNNNNNNKEMEKQSNARAVHKEYG